MEDRRKAFIIDLVFGAVIVAFVAIVTAKRQHSLVHLLSDGCFTAAVLLLGTGGLKFVRNEGMFDIFSYSMKSVFTIHFPSSKMNSPLQEKKESFVDYKERKKQTRKPPHDLLWAGLVYFALTVVLIAVYLLVPGL